MSAVHGPMPCTAVSAAWAVVGRHVGEPAEGERRRATARAIALRARIFGADRPRRPSRSARARRSAAGSNGSKAAASRAQIAPALAVESCWETTIAASPAKPPGRRRSGGRPGGDEQRRKPRIGACQRGERNIEIGFGMDVGLHRAAPRLAQSRRSIMACDCKIAQMINLPARRGAHAKVNETAS